MAGHKACNHQGRLIPETPEVSGLAHSEIMKSEMPSKFWSYTTRQGTLPRSTSINHLHLPEEGTLDKGICLSEIQLDIRSRTEG